MRDPKRIEPFAQKLAACWQQVPDWRFGQLMSNFLGFAYEKSKKDIFFIEENEMESLLDEFFKPNETEDASWSADSGEL